MAKICGTCKRWQAPSPGDTTMTCPHDGPAQATVTRCKVCSTVPRASDPFSAEEVASTPSKHNSAAFYHDFDAAGE